MKDENSTVELIDLGAASILTLGDPDEKNEGIELPDTFA